MTKIASHRGGTHLWPENSRLAFRQTCAMPVELVEFDVHRTLDGTLVVHHDATIDRMTDGRGEIAKLSFDALSRQVIIGTGGETIPTLAEVVDIFRPSKVDLRLEIKTPAAGGAYPEMEAEIVELLVQREMLQRTLVTSFALERLQAFRAAMGARGQADNDVLGLMWLCAPAILHQCGMSGTIAAMRATSIDEIGLRAEAVTAETVAIFRDAGIRVHAWAAHDQASALTMFELSIDSFTTDRPDLALLARREFLAR